MLAYELSSERLVGWQRAGAGAGKPAKFHVGSWPMVLWALGIRGTLWVSLG